MDAAQDLRVCRTHKGGRERQWIGESRVMVVIWKLIEFLSSCIGTKFLGQYGSFACKLAIKAVQTVYLEENGRKEIDIKRYARIEKVPGGTIEESEVLDGVMLNKDVVHPKMLRWIENPKIIQ